jgi:replicative DNA helicase
MSRPAPAEPDSTTAEPNSSGLNSPAAWHAERAVLGALLHKPQRATELNTWLHAHDFTDPTHQAVYAAINNLQAAGQFKPVPDEPASDPSRQAVAHNMLAVRDVLMAQATDGPPISHQQLVALYHAGATTTTAQYTRYGRMILEMSIRRQLHDWATHLEHVVTLTEPALSPTPRDALLQQLNAIGTRTTRSTGLAIDSPPASPTHTALETRPIPLPRKLVERAERQVIQAVITNPQWQNVGLLESLQPDDFVTSPIHRNAWRAIQHLAHRGELIDPIMVAWETESFSLQQPPTSDLAIMVNPPHGDIQRAVSIVAQSALARIAQQSQDAIQQASANRTQTLDEVLTTSHTTITRLEQYAARLAAAIRPDHRTSIRDALDGRAGYSFDPHRSCPQPRRL